MAPFVVSDEESETLDVLLSPVGKNLFKYAIDHLHTQFSIYAKTSPSPLPTRGLIVTREIRIQCELYLPIANISTIFNRLYSAALSYVPIISSTPFHKAMSWADVFSILPPEFQKSANPARLLEALLDDRPLLIRFLTASFLPKRFYGNVGRYPEQQRFIREWLVTRNGAPLCCLDAACGIGVDTYALALLIKNQPLSAANICIEGWTLEPLEVWAASHLRVLHDQETDNSLRNSAASLKDLTINFRCRNLFTPFSDSESYDQTSYKTYDLILCNGLLGGPIIHEMRALGLAVANLTRILSPGGILLAANHFHGGWKQQCPQNNLRALLEEHGLVSFEAGEGIGGLKPD